MNDLELIVLSSVTIVNALTNINAYIQTVSPKKQNSSEESLINNYKNFVNWSKNYSDKPNYSPSLMTHISLFFFAGPGIVAGTFYNKTKSLINYDLKDFLYLFNDVMSKK